MTTTQAQAEQSPPITLRRLLEAGAHFGHPTKRWHPKMAPYIFTARNKIHVFDLSKTITKLEEAAEFVSDVVSKGGQVMLVGTKKQAQEAIADAGRRTGTLYVNQRWLGGMLTNFQTIQKRIEYVVRLEDEIAHGTLQATTKREAQKAATEVQRLNKFLGGIKQMVSLPQTLFVVDLSKERIAVAEAKRLNIPVVAIVDTNCDPTGIDYAIPANDDAIRSVKLITDRIADAILEGQQRRSAAVVEQQALDAEIEEQEEAARQAAQAEAAARLAVAEAARREAEEVAARTAATEAAPATPAAESSAENPTKEPVPTEAPAPEASTDDAPAAEAAAEEPAATETPAEASVEEASPAESSADDTPAAEAASEQPAAAEAIAEKASPAESSSADAPAAEEPSTEEEPAAETGEDQPAGDAESTDSGEEKATE